MSWMVYFGTMAVLWAIIAVMGGAVAVFSLLAWRRERSRPLLLLGAGLLLISVVPALMWTGMYAATDNLYATSLYCAGVMVGGFALILGSVLSRSA